MPVNLKRIIKLKLKPKLKLLLLKLKLLLLQYIFGIHSIKLLCRLKRTKYVQNGKRTVIRCSLCTKEICEKFYVQRCLEKKFYVQRTAVGEIICTAVILCTMVFWKRRESSEIGEI